MGSMKRLWETGADRHLVARCVAGESDAVRQFQETFGELVYGFPIRAYRVAPDEAGDFYVFAFDGGRIFRRIRTFEGRTSLRAYLTGCVLDNLVLEWKRRQRAFETIPLDSIAEVGEDARGDRSDGSSLADLLRPLDAEKVLLLKLLYIEDFDLEPVDVRLLAQLSRRPIREVVRGIDRLRRTVRERESRVKQIDDALDAVQGWIRLYERGLRDLRERMAIPATGDPQLRARLDEELAELERKTAWRKRQRASLLERSQRRKVTAPYKEVAELLNTSVGTLGSRIKRLRDELARAGMQGMMRGETNDTVASDG